MFCSVKDRACLDISVPGLGMDVIDLFAASKNIPNAFSAWSMVFSARSRNSAGTSNFGSIMVASDFGRTLPYSGRLSPPDWRLGPAHPAGSAGGRNTTGVGDQPPETCAAM